MFEKKSISEIKDWSHIDYVCIKAKSGDLFEDIYYLDGHKFFESSLTEADINFINFTRGINSYGISEKMVGESSTLDQFAAGFESLPIIENVDLLRNVIYSGVFTRFGIAKNKREQVEEV